MNTRIIFCLAVLMIAAGISEAQRNIRQATAFSGKNNEHIDLLSGLGSLFGGGPSKQCNFKCTVGQPHPRRSHVPTSNGCGSMGISVEVTPAMVACCDTHDKCYDTCLKTKTECDDAFSKCLSDVCSTSVPAEEKEGCEGQGQLLSVGVSTFGCKSYLDSQKQACVCVHDDL